MGFGSSFKKFASNPGRVGLALGTMGGSEIYRSLGNALKPPGINVPYGDPNADLSLFNQYAADEEAKRKALGLQQQGQINTFADEQAKRASAYRGTLAKSLADTSQSTFQRMNPGILEDLNSRGLFTSQTARDTEQGRVLGDLAREQNQQLSDFDTSTFNQLNDIRGTGLSALLGGDQSALDAALGLRKAGLTRSFDVADTNREMGFSKQLAKRQSYDQLLQSLLGLGGKLGSAAIAG